MKRGGWGGIVMVRVLLDLCSGDRSTHLVHDLFLLSRCLGWRNHVGVCSRAINGVPQASRSELDAGGLILDKKGVHALDHPRIDAVEAGLPGERLPSRAFPVKVPVPVLPTLGVVHPQAPAIHVAQVACDVSHVALEEGAEDRGLLLHGLLGRHHRRALAPAPVRVLNKADARDGGSRATEAEGERERESAFFISCKSSSAARLCWAISLPCHAQRARLVVLLLDLGLV